MASPPRPAASGGVVLAVAAAALLFGAGNTFTTKVLITAMPCDASCAAPGVSPGASVPFNKPIFTTLVAFGGMAAGVFYYAALWARARRGRRDTSGGGSGDESAAKLLDAAAEGGGGLVVDDGALSGESTSADGSGVVSASHRSSSHDGGGALSASSLAAAAGRAAVRYRPLAVPACLDVTATALQASASLFIPAAVNAVLRGSILLFTALANRLFGVRDGAADRREWTAIGVSMTGIVLVGISSVLNSGVAAVSDGSASSGGEAGALSPAAAAVVGVSLALLSNAVQAVQVAYETRFLEGAVYAPVEANAAEGVIGVAVCAAILAAAQAVPAGPDNGHLEDTGQTSCCLARTPPIAGVSLLLWALFGASTVAHMQLSLLRGSNFRSFILCGRSLLVWAAEFAAFYASGGGGDLGTGWQAYSWLEALGFVVLVAGGVAQYVAQSARERAAAAAAAAGSDAGAKGGVDVVGAAFEPGLG